MKTLTLLFTLIAYVGFAQLPIELKSFEVDEVNTNELVISFSTASELNVDKFVLYDNEVLIKEIKAANAPNDYVLRHSTLNKSGIITLVSLDFDGKIENFKKSYRFNQDNRYYQYDYTGRFIKVTESLESGFIFCNSNGCIKR